ncbi:hypothetical protein BDV97DRAFT_73062 [Delphinella strobiligena]|nr:hypothetical protein BDV97DRAFT_73062 [Delphinella strobiligena]
MSPSTITPYAEAARMENETNVGACALDQTAISNSGYEVPGALEDSSAAVGIHPASECDTSPKEVRFDPQVNVIKIPELQLTEPARVKFNDKVVDIDADVLDHATTTTPSTTNKHVRFSCLKQPKQPLSHGMTLLRMLKRRTLGHVSTASLIARKQVRFGALKCHKTSFSDLSFGFRDSRWDEAETRRTFKRECMKYKALQPMSTIKKCDEDDDDWNST